MFMAYDWRVVVVEKFLILHYIEDAMSKLVVLQCFFCDYDSCRTKRCHWLVHISQNYYCENCTV